MPITQLTAGDPNARAKVAADVKYGAQEAAVQRAIAALAGSRQADEASINTYGTAGRSAINDTFDQLAGNLGTNRDVVNRDLGIQVDSVGQGYRDANSVAEAARQRALDNLDQTYGNNSAYQTVNKGKFADPIESLAAQVIGENAHSDATYTGNLKNWAAQQDALMQSGIAGAGRDRSNRLAGFEGELLNSIAQSKNQRSQQEYDYNAKLSDILGERGSFESSAAADYLDQLFGQQVTAANYNLNESNSIADQSYKQASLAQQASELAAKVDMARADGARADRTAARADQSQNNDDYWRQLEYNLKLKGVDQETAQWLAQQGQQDFTNKMGIGDFLSKGVGVDSYGKSFNYTSALADILYGTGAMQRPAGQSAAPAASVPTGVGAGTGNSAYGSKTRTPVAPVAKPVTPLPTPLNMRSAIGGGFR